MKYKNITERCEYSEKDHIEYCSVKVNEICIISVYNSPNSSFDVLKKHMYEVITISRRFCEDMIVVGDFNLNLKIKANQKFIEYMGSFGLALMNKLNKSSTNAKTQIDYCFSNINGLKSDYFESLTSFHKPVWIGKRDALTDSHADVDVPTFTDVNFKSKGLYISDQLDTMEIDNEFSFNEYELVEEGEKSNMNTAFDFGDPHIDDDSNTMEIDEHFLDNYETVDLTSRNILDRFCHTLELNKNIDTDQILSHAHMINDLIQKSPFVTVNNRDISVRLTSIADYSVSAFDSVYARTRTTADGNCFV